MKSNLGYPRLDKSLLVKSYKVEIPKFGPLKSQINDSEGEHDMEAEGDQLEMPEKLLHLHNEGNYNDNSNDTSMQYV